ncbi:MAG: hypothetical protein IPG71_06895 [bacterium]|nr:hypothetical protein [bacterium]
MDWYHNTTEAPQAADLEALVETDATNRTTPRSTQGHGLATIWLPKAKYPLLFRNARAKFETEFLKRMLRRYH